MGERPEFCIKSDCPYYHSYRFCRLKQWIMENWQSVIGRKGMVGRYNELAKKDPQEVISDCARR